MNPVACKDSAQPARVLYVGSAYGHVPRRVAMMQNRGYEGVLVAPASRRDAGFPNIVPGALVEPRLFGRFYLVEQIHRIVRRESLDIIHVHSALSAPAWLVAAVSDAPIVVSTMGGDIFFTDGFRSRSGRMMVVRLLAMADVVTAKTPAMLDRLCELGVERERVEIVNWGVDTAVFKPRERAQCRARFGIPIDKEVVLSSRAMDPLYNIDVIVESFSVLRQTRPGVLLVLVESAQNADYAHAIHALVKRLNLEDSVLYLSEVSFIDMPLLYGAADVLVSIPKQDAAPQTLFEAMACGLPCLLPDLATLRALAKHGETAWFCATDVSAVSDALWRLLDNAALRSHLAKQGRAYVVEAANIEKSIDVVDALYRRLSRRRRARRTLSGRLKLLATWLAAPLIDRVCPVKQAAP